MGYSAKEQKSTSPLGIISFQWDSVDGEDVYINGFVTPSVAGTAYDHGKEDDPTSGWELLAPQIQIRRADGGYNTLYYADDMWDEEKGESVAGWGGADGVLDKTTTVEVGGGFWLKQPNGDRTIYVTVKNPVK